MRLITILVFCSTNVLCVGCGGGAMVPTDPQAQVSGSVMNNGKPIAMDSVVVFFSEERGLTLTGKVDSVGKYALSAGDPRLGIPAGRYAVAVTPPVAAVIEDSQGSQEYTKIMQASGANAAISKGGRFAQDIPEKFRDPKTSRLVFEVKPGANKCDLDLSKR